VKFGMKFGDKVGWRRNNQWLYYNDLTFSEKTAVEAHLPVGFVAVGLGEEGGRVVNNEMWKVVWLGMGYLFSRVETCRL